MTDYRQQAIKIVAEALKLDADILGRQMDIDPLCLFNSAPSNVYAVHQTEARLKLEDALRKFMDTMAFTPSSVPGAIEKDLKDAYESARALLPSDSGSPERSQG